MKTNLCLLVTLPLLTKMLSELIIGKFVGLSLSLQFFAFSLPKSPCCPLGWFYYQGREGNYHLLITNHVPTPVPDAFPLLFYLVT